MNFSKSILIFLFFSSVSGAFYYALKRTDGNVYQSIMFTMYFLAIKIGLITPNIPPKLDQYQPNQQLISRVIESPGYHPYVSLYDEYRPSGLYMDKIEQPAPQHYVSSHSQSVINELRAGSRLTEAAWLLLTIWMLQQQSVGFQPVIPVVRPPHVEAAHNLLFGKPKSDGQSRLHLSNSNEISTNVMPTQTQLSGFVKNGKVDLNQAFSEVNRRASAIGCETFDCSFARFKKLATECGEIKESGVREAITILQGEMQGYYKNARRVDYGPNVKSLDFAVDGLGKFENITHAEAKNAVGSAIEIADGFDANIWKQGKKIGKKSVWQKRFWSNTSRTSEVPNLNSDAYLPESVNNTLTVVDCYDVPNFEKQTMNNAINFGAKNDTNLIILNNRTNI